MALSLCHHEGFRLDWSSCSPCSGTGNRPDVMARLVRCNLRSVTRTRNHEHMPVLRDLCRILLILAFVSGTLPAAQSAAMPEKVFMAVDAQTRCSRSQALR
jgi:hypothetical protein